MGFLLAIVLGCATFHGLHDYFHVNDDLATNLGWAVGIIVLGVCEMGEQILAKLGTSTKRMALKARVKELELENKELKAQLANKQEVKTKMDFFKQAAK